MHGGQSCLYLGMANGEQLELQCQQAPAAVEAHIEPEIAQRAQLSEGLLYLATCLRTFSIRVVISRSSSARNKSSLLSKLA